jgi:hypothetical protein
MGIEPTSEAWEASILPLYDARSLFFIVLEKWFLSRFFVSTRSRLSGAKVEGTSISGTLRYSCRYPAAPRDE